MDMHEDAYDRPLRPGAEHFRQAIICLPVGLVALIVGTAVVESNDAVGSAALLLGLVFAGIGVMRLLQGLWHRVA